MITNAELREAIAECLRTPNPNANTCIKLAAYYAILDHVMVDGKISADSGDVVSYAGDSEFAETVNGRNMGRVMGLMDELMTTLQAVNPKLYDTYMLKLNEV